MCRKEVQIAVMNTLENVIDLKIGIKTKWNITPYLDIADQLQKQIECARQERTSLCCLTNTRIIMTANRQPLRFKQTTTAILLTRKATTSRKNSQFKKTFGRDCT